MVKYLVANFPKEKRLEAIPASWVNTDTMLARWPPFKSQQKIRTAIQNGTRPEANWSTLPVEIMGGSGKIHCVT